MTHSLSCQKLLKSNLRRNSLQRVSCGRTFSSGQWRWVHVLDKPSCPQSHLLTLAALGAPSVQVWQEAAQKFWELQCFDTGVTECFSSIKNQEGIWSRKLLWCPVIQPNTAGSVLPQLLPQVTASTPRNPTVLLWDTKHHLYPQLCSLCSCDRRDLIHELQLLNGNLCAVEKHE